MKDILKNNKEQQTEEKIMIVPMYEFLNKVIKKKR